MHLGGLTSGYQHVESISRRPRLRLQGRCLLPSPGVLATQGRPLPARIIRQSTQHQPRPLHPDHQHAKAATPRPLSARRGPRPSTAEHGAAALAGRKWRSCGHRAARSGEGRRLQRCSASRWPRPAATRRDYHPIAQQT